MSNGTVTIINTTPYKLQPVPEVGKEYHIFDDGKVSMGRHYIAEILEVIPFGEASTDLKYAWAEQVKDCYWLYSELCDYFVKAKSDFDSEPLYFVRTTDGGWFSLDYPNVWMSARLDIDGSLYKQMIEWYSEK